MNGWKDVFDQQMELLRFWRSDLGQLHAERMEALVEGEGDPDDYSTLIGGLAGWEEVNLRAAEPIYVGPDPYAIVTEAARSFEPEALLRSDLIVERGFVALPGVLPARRDEIPVPAFSFGVEASAVVFVFYTPSDDRAPGYPALKPVGASLWPFDKDWNDLIQHAPSEEAARDGAEWGSWVQVLFRVAKQRIMVEERRAAPRPARRRAVRSGLDPKETVVMRLRRGVQKPVSEEREIEWSHRWLVRSHWRNQWYPSIGAHRQKLILGYVKGPEDKPLEVADRAVEFAR